MARFPLQCPSCDENLMVKSLRCENCETEVIGAFSVPTLASLDHDDQKFILEFVKSSGSIKVMAQQLKLSYPTVRNRLDDLIDRIKKVEKEQEKED